MKYLGIVIFVFVNTAYASTQFVRNCRVFSEPKRGAGISCKRKQGSKVQSAKALNERIIYIDSQGCTGYVRKNCLSEIESKEVERKTADLYPRRESIDREVRNIKPLVSIQASVGGLRGKVPSTETQSKGVGYGFGLEGGIEVSQWLQFSLGLTYEKFKLGRTVDATGILKNGSVEDFDHVIQYLGVVLMGRISLKRPKVKKGKGTVSWWFESGVEYLIPISATQIDTVAGERDFNFNEKAMLLLAGLVGNYRLSPKFHIVSRVQIFYNLQAAADSGLTGLRAGLALQLGL